MPHRPSAAARPAGHIGCRLYGQPQLTIDDLLGADHEPVHAHQHRGATATLNQRQGSLLLQSAIRRMTRPVPASMDFGISRSAHRGPQINARPRYGRVVDRREPES